MTSRGTRIDSGIDNGHRAQHSARDARAPRRRMRWASVACLASAVLLQSALPGMSQAPPTGPEARPYDERLMRLSELLGSVHFLRELCGGNDGQLWRERMRELMDAEGSSALRKAKLSRSFNTGYRSYSRTYTTCTPSAQTAVGRFLIEAADIAETMVKTVP